MIGLGRMGGNMARRLVRGRHEVVAYDLSPEAIEALEADGAIGARSLVELVGRLDAPRAVWLSLPAGEVTGLVLEQIAPLLTPGDTIVDSGNSFYKETVVRARQLKGRGISLLDQGTSGGVWGLEKGYNLMIGGEPAAFERLEPAFKTLAP